jgi:hypothetical protein
MRLLTGSDPTSVGVEEEEKNHAEGHEVHVDEKENAAVIEAPAWTHAAQGVHGTGGCGESGQGEEGCSAVVREVRKKEGEAEA